MNIIGFWNISDDNNILTQNNTQQMLPPIEGNFITTHCSVNQEQHKKVRIQIEAYQEAITKSQINHFVSDIYKNNTYYCDYSASWFKYWHLKEALVSHLLNVKIRLFINNSKSEEITPPEPIHEKNYREVYVWTDKKAFHDTELIPSSYFALMAQGFRFELVYFNMQSDNKNLLQELTEKHKIYHQEWLTR